MWPADEKGEFPFASGSTRIALREPFYIGFGVCSHDKDVVEKAVFSNVELNPQRLLPLCLTCTAHSKSLPLPPPTRRAIYVAPEEVRGA